jgi:hypothetical protein
MVGPLPVKISNQFAKRKYSFVGEKASEFDMQNYSQKLLT